jgi:hypothetical protein
MSDLRIFHPPQPSNENPHSPRNASWWKIGIGASVLMASLFALRIPQTANGTEPETSLSSKEPALPIAEVAHATNKGRASQLDWRVSPDECFLLDDFNGDIQNRVGGYRNVFFRDPSSAMTRRERGDASNSSPVVSAAPTGQGRVLRLSGRRAETGFCGAWVHLFDMRSRRPVFLDASPWNFLTFWIRGASGGESVRFEAADLRWYRKEDARPIGHCSEFLPHGITTSWQQVVIPREKLAGLNLRELASVSFEFTGPGEQTVFIDDLCLKQSPELLPVDPLKTAAEFEANSRLSAKRKPRALWIWSTAELIRDKAQCDDLFESCRVDGISLLWMQLPYELDSSSESAPAESVPSPLGGEGARRAGEGAVQTGIGMPTPNSETPSSGLRPPSPPRGEGTNTRCRISSPVELRRFLKRAHDLGINVHALDGCPEFALQEFHSVPLAVVDEVVRFNSQSSPAERFKGIHLDNEPYLILGWQEPSQREEILRDFLNLNVECQRRAVAAGIEYGIDIPFWWNAFNPDGEPPGTVTFRGERKPASFHCIDLLDNVGIMNYRDTADGADGMIAHGRDLLRYADSVDGADLFMGVETFRYDPQPVWFLLGLTEDRFQAALKDRGNDFSLMSRRNDLRLFHFHDGRRVHIGIELPSDVVPPDEAGRVSNEAKKRVSTLREIAIRFGHFSAGANDDELLDAVSNSIDASPEWTTFQRRDLFDDELGVSFPGFISTRQMLSKVTFADDPYADLQFETGFAEESFSRFECYRGLAIHSWESYRGKHPLFLGKAAPPASRSADIRRGLFHH